MIDTVRLRVSVGDCDIVSDFVLVSDTVRVGESVTERLFV